MARTTLALILIVLMADEKSVFAQAAQQSAAAPAAGQPAAPDAAAVLSADQLDSLVAPIALYPDPLLSQTLVASTYPLEVVQLQQWMGQHKDLKDQALVDAVKKQDWDPSIQSLAALPDVVKLLSENIKWTTDLGNAFLAQQADVMDAVQRMRKKAQDKGSLKTTEQQKVETQVVEQKQVIVIEQANPQVIYVPTYNPTVVYPPPVYAYPPVVYPPYYGVGMAFTAGIIMGAAFSGGWGYNCGWGSSNVNINVNNNYVKNSNRNQVNNGMANGGRGGNNSWQHNPAHRGGAPYGDRKTASQYGGTARGDSASTREANARQQQSQRGPSAGTSDRGASGGADRGPSAGTSDRGASGGADRSPSGPSAGTSDRGGGGADRGASAGNRGGGGDHVGNRSVPSSPSSSDRSAFGGSSSGGSSARASSSRGSSSMRGGGGGGGRRR
jgi:hypothetical protein